MASPPDKCESCDTQGSQQRQGNHNLLVGEPSLARNLVHLGLHKGIEWLSVHLHHSTAGPQIHDLGLHKGISWLGVDLHHSTAGAQSQDLGLHKGIERLGVDLHHSTAGAQFKA